MQFILFAKVEDLPWYRTGALGLLLPDDLIIGVVMWTILLMGILAFGVVLERYRLLLMLPTDDKGLRGKVLDLLRADRIEDALELCHRTQGPIAAILAAGIRKFAVLRRLEYDPARIEEQVVKAMDDYSVHIFAALERHLPILGTVSAVAPMLGSVGTVAGMMVLFGGIVEKVGQVSLIEAAATGIKGKLVTTLFGLVVGIFAYVAYNYFTAVINRYVLGVEESATELMEGVTMNLALKQKQAGMTRLEA
jgi:biopolymer transport protein ExbB